MRARRGFEAPRLANPEQAWRGLGLALEPAELQTLARARAGDLTGEPELLSAAPGRLELALDPERILLVYEGGRERLEGERALLLHPWRHLGTPQVLAEGHDFLVLRREAPRPLEDSPLHGRALGVALAEIHADVRDRREVAPASAELWLGASLRVAAQLPPHIAEQVQRFLAARRTELLAWAGESVRVQGAFGVAGLGWLDAGPWVPDWSRARPGPALLDVGRLVRWGASTTFLEAFAEGYRAGDGRLPKEWRQAAGWFDVLNLASDLAGAKWGSALARAFEARLERSAI